MEELRLFRTPNAYVAVFRLDRDGTWALHIDTMYEGEPWAMNNRDRYESLSLLEAAGVLLDTISVAPL